MPQRPTGINAITWANRANIRDFVTREVFGGDYAGLDSSHKLDIDNLAEDAFFEMTNILKWFAASDSGYVNPSSSDAPAELNELFKITWVAKALRRFRSLDDGAKFQKQYAEPTTLRALTALDANFNTGDAFASDELTIRSLRRHVISVMVRQRTPTIPPFEVVGQIIRDEFVKLWNHARWRWRVRHKKATLTEFVVSTSTGGDILLPEGDTDVMDTLASKRIYIKTSTGSRVPVLWLDETRTAEAAIRYDGKRGTPRFFYDEDRGPETPIVFHWLPNPDQDFTVFFSMVLKAPAFTSDPNSSAGLSLLPVEFRANLRDYVTAKVLHLWGREDNDAARVFAVAKAERRELAAAWVDPGASRYTARGHHGLRFHRDLTSYPFSGISGQLN